MRHYKTIKEFDFDQNIVAMQEFGGKLYVATSQSIWRLEGEDLIPLEFVVKEDGD